MVKNIGIFWWDHASSKVTQLQKQWLRTTLSGYIKAGTSVEKLPVQLGEFQLGGVGKVRDLWLTKDGILHDVGRLIENPTSSGLPADGNQGCLDYVDSPMDKPKLIKKDPPGFGWNPHGDED